MGIFFVILEVFNFAECCVTFVTFFVSKKSHFELFEQIYRGIQLEFCSYLTDSFIFSSALSKSSLRWVLLCELSVVCVGNDSPHCMQEKFRAENSKIRKPTLNYRRWRRFLGGFHGGFDRWRPLEGWKERKYRFRLFVWLKAKSIITHFFFFSFSRGSSKRSIKPWLI